MQSQVNTCKCRGPMVDLAGKVKCGFIGCENYVILVPTRTLLHASCGYHSVGRLYK